MPIVLRSLLLLLLTSALASAQAVSTAQINGAVKDSGGLALPGVTVTVTQTDTGLTRTVVTNETGAYIITSLPVGPYRVEASLQGFRTYAQTGIVLEVNSNPTLNVTLQVGELAETITVEGTAPLVETRNPGIGQVVTNEQVLELPLNGRQLTQLVLTAGMATPSAGLGSNGLSTPRNYPSALISVAGGLANGINYILDGANHNDPYASVNLPLPFPDAMQEFKVETNALPAQYGFHSAAAVNAITKSGTNTLHGDVFEFLRDHRLNAKNAFAAIDPATGKRRDDGLRRDQFGGTLGGPIVQNKLFYFAGYQGTRIDVTPSTFFQFVPTPQMLAGDFSAIASAACNAGRSIALRAPFDASNRISPALFSPAAVNIAARLPKTNDPCGRVEFSRKTHNFENLAIGRVDYTMSSRHTVFTRYELARYEAQPDNDPNNVLAYSFSPINDTVHSIVAGDTYLLSSNAVSSFRFGYNSIDIQKPWVPQFGGPDVGIRMADMMPGFLRVTATGAFTLGNTGASSSSTPTRGLHLSEDLSVIRGSHQLGFGGSVVRQEVDGSTYINTTGPFTFSGATTGLALGDFMIGRAQTFAQGNRIFIHDRSTYAGLYAQDAWTLAQRLTINAGLRWEPYLPFVEENGQFSHFDFDQFRSGVRSTVYRNAPAGVIFSGDPEYPGNSAGRRDLAEFAPRLSAAWDVNGNGKMTVRSAWGRFYDLPHLWMLFGFATAPPLGSTLVVSGPLLDDPFANVAGGNPFPLVRGPNMTFPQFANWVTFPLDLKKWYADQWNISLQRQLGTSWAASVNYVSSRGHRLPIGDNINPAVFQPGATTANVNQRRLLFLENPAQGQYYGNIIAMKPVGTSVYDALLLSLNRRASRGLSLTGNWTVSRCITDLINYEPGMAGFALSKPGDVAYDRGSCGGGDRKHVANGTAVYQVPAFATGALGVLTNNWQIAGILRAQSGDHFNVTTGADSALTGQTNQRPNQVLADPYLKQGNQWLNPAAFQAPAPGTYGNVPINAFVGPGAFNVDMGITRSFHTGGTREIQFRAELFNVFNTMQKLDPLTPPSAVAALNSPTFGQITTAADPRIVQLALKYVF
jgi:hypothetical protein